MSFETSPHVCYFFIERQAMVPYHKNSRCNCVVVRSQHARVESCISVRGEYFANNTWPTGMADIRFSVVKESADERCISWSSCYKYRDLKHISHQGHRVLWWKRLLERISGGCASINSLAVSQWLDQTDMTSTLIKRHCACAVHGMTTFEPASEFYQL